MDQGQQTVHYATQDPMPNLRLRVTLTLLSAARLRPAAREYDQAPSSTPQTGAAGDGQDATPHNSRPSARPEATRIQRTFGWQEKVYSKAELVAAQAHHQANKQQGRPVSSPRRAAHFGSQTHVGADKLLSASPEGSILFTYVQTEGFCERYEANRCVTTSKWEQRNHLARKLATDARNRQKMLNFQSMCIVADLGDETTMAGSNEKVLCVIRAHHDGSFDMTPGLSTPSQRYRFEDDHGSIYEYTLELASLTSVPSLEQHTAKLAGAVAAQAEELRAQHNKDRLPVPGPDSNALRLLLLAELVSAAGFMRDRLYIEWQLRFDPDIWILQHSEQEVVQPGLVQGVTHVSQMVRYAADPATDTPPVWVAHFAHPIEVEWIARAAPAPKDWPQLLMQVCTYDPWDRATTEGYGWQQLHATSSSGSNTFYVDTWKPLGSRRDQQQAFFIGGSEELQELSYLSVPQGHSGKVLNKYGYKTQTSGNVKVRTHMVLQTGAAGGASPSKAAVKKVAAAAAAARQRRSVSLAVVLERARSRLQEARGGEVMVREGLLVQPPSITAQPADVSVNEGADVQLSVSAVGLGPLRYQWFRNNKRLTVATSNSPLLVLVDVAAADSGSYHCCVSNKDGTATSSKALVTVSRVGRLHAAAASVSGDPAAAGAEGVPEQASSSGAAAAAAAGASPTSTLLRRSTIPRTLPVGGSPSLPFSLRLGSSAGGPGADPTAAAGAGDRRPGSLSPLRTSLALSSSRPQSAAGRLAGTSSAAAAPAAGTGAAGGVSAGRSGVNVPLRRFAASSRPSTAPAAESMAAASPADTGAATQQGTSEAGVAETAAAAAAAAATGQGTVGSTRRVSGGWFAAADTGSNHSSPRSSAGADAAGPDRLRHQQQLEQQGQQQLPPVQAGQPVQPVVPAEPAAGPTSGLLTEGVGAGRAPAAGSPARLGSQRRTRVSEQG